jgi:predicted nucleic acid-binding protein
MIPVCQHPGRRRSAVSPGTSPPGLVTRPVELTTAAGQHAGRLTRSHALRGADAVHLASALAVGDSDLVMAVWDRRLHQGARSAGLRVAPAAPGP